MVVRAEIHCALAYSPDCKNTHTLHCRSDEPRITYVTSTTGIPFGPNRARFYLTLPPRIVSSSRLKIDGTLIPEEMGIFNE